MIGIYAELSARNKGMLNHPKLGNVASKSKQANPAAPMAEAWFFAPSCGEILEQGIRRNDLSKLDG